MRGAMGRFLTVNDFEGRDRHSDLPQTSSEDLRNLSSSDGIPKYAPDSATSSTQGPCLYLGPSGQRCSRQALQGGFCIHHQPDAVIPEKHGRGLTKVAGAGIGILAAMWPIIFDLVRALIRWIHAH